MADEDTDGKVTKKEWVRVRWSITFKTIVITLYINYAKLFYLCKHFPIFTFKYKSSIISQDVLIIFIVFIYASSVKYMY